MVKISRDHLHRVNLCAVVGTGSTLVATTVTSRLATGGGHKHHYRVVDFRRIKDGIQPRSAAVYSNVLRTSALICYADGERATSSPPWP
jgi:large subunit ribosomal protein L2